MKKMIAYAFLASFVCVGLAACGEKKEGTEKKTEPAAKTEEKK